MPIDTAPGDGTLSRESRPYGMQDNQTWWRRVAADLLVAVALWAAFETFAAWRIVTRLVPGALTAGHGYVRLLVADHEAAARKAAAPQPPTPPAGRATQP